jgi:hypothetical protein
MIEIEDEWAALREKYPPTRCIFRDCVATWQHWHGGFWGGYDNPDDPEGAPIPFVGGDPQPGVVRDYNGAALR